MAAQNFWQRDVREILSLVPRKIPPAQIAVLCRKLSILLDAGVPIGTALQIASESDMGHAGRALDEIRARVTRGDGLARALEESGEFPAYMCAVCAIGEASAQLPQVMGQLADYYERQTRDADELSAALIYPAAVALMMLGVIVLSVTFVLPGFAQVFAASDAELPGLTRALLTVAEVLAAYFYWFAAGAAALALGLFLWARSASGQELRARIGLRLPIYRQQINLRLAQSLSLLLASGQTLAEALPVCAEIFSPVIQRDLAGLRAGLSGGEPFWKLLSEIRYMDTLLVSLARVGEETGRLPQALGQCRQYFEQAQRRTVARLNKLTEPVITIVLGLVLGLIMLSVILPTFALTDVY